MLTPDKTYTANGVAVKMKIIPDSMRWKNATSAAACGFKAGERYKACKKLNGNGKPASITVHNTAYAAGAVDNAELYTRATYNENMGAARVHFYVDDIGAWQNLKAGTGINELDPVGSAEVGWHAGDSSISDGGNQTSIGIEIIMGGSSERDKKAMDNGARLIAWLLGRYGLSIDRVYTHTYWVNHKAGKRFSSADMQCTSPISGLKWCPYYIFGGTNPNVARSNWTEFKGKIWEYCIEEKHNKAKTLEVGDKVKLAEDAVVYGSSKRFADFVYTSLLYVRQIKGDRVVISTLQTGDITGAIDIKYLRRL